MEVVVTIHSVAEAHKYATNCDDLAIIGAFASTSASFALAIIVDAIGPTYRPIGTMMAVDTDCVTTGSLSSGCIEADVVRHAQLALQSGQPQHLRYGAGSPWLDLMLPCGGAVDIVVIPRPEVAAFAEVTYLLSQRQQATITFPISDEHAFSLTLLPPIKSLIFGTGAEATHAAHSARDAGMQCQIFSPDRGIVEACEQSEI
ncbi:MAG: XdhC family protein [Nitrospira sp.]|nr:XdhC family protein [Nitrospira sp.]